MCDWPIARSLFSRITKHCTGLVFFVFKDITWLLNIFVNIYKARWSVNDTNEKLRHFEFTLLPTLLIFRSSSRSNFHLVHNIALYIYSPLHYSGDFRVRYIASDMNPNILLHISKSDNEGNAYACSRLRSRYDFYQKALPLKFQKSADQIVSSLGEVGLRHVWRNLAKAGPEVGDEWATSRRLQSADWEHVEWGRSEHSHIYAIVMAWTTIGSAGAFFSEQDRGQLFGRYLGRFLLQKDQEDSGVEAPRSQRV